MINYLKKKWGIESSSQFIVVMVVFALTGSVAALLSKPLLTILNLNNIPQVFYWPLRLTIIFPVYQILLILFGYIFGLIISIFSGKKDMFIFEFFLKMSKVFTKGIIKILTLGFYK